MNPYDGWQGGILIIGTFGYSNDDINYNPSVTIKDIGQNAEKEQLVENDDVETQVVVRADDWDDEDNEVKPLVYAAANYDYYESLLEMKMEEEEDRVEEKRRITLAELFSAESSEEDDHLKKKEKEEEPININININKQEILMVVKDKSNYKHGLCRLPFAKKLLNVNNVVPDDHNASRPIRKLNRVSQSLHFLILYIYHHASISCYSITCNINQFFLF